MQLRAHEYPTTSRYEVQLARAVVTGQPNAYQAATTLLELCDPASLDRAVGLIADRGAVTVEAFDRLADAWERFRHVKDLSVD